MDKGSPNWECWGLNWQYAETTATTLTRAGYKKFLVVRSQGQVSQA